MTRELEWVNYCLGSVTLLVMYPAVLGQCTNLPPKRSLGGVQERFSQCCSDCPQFWDNVHTQKSLIDDRNEHRYFYDGDYWFGVYSVWLDTVTSELDTELEFW